MTYRSQVEPRPASNPVGVYDLFMAVIGIIGLGLICFRLTLDDHNEVAKLVDWFDSIICLAFLGDFVRNAMRANSLSRYLCTWGMLDLISSVPVMNSFRWARLARLIRVFRLIKSVAIIVRSVRRERKSALLVGTIAVAASTLAICCVGVLHFEQAVDGANIQTAEDAIWWSIVTLASVGYGDRYPITSEGRFLAGWLMLTGVVMFAAFAGIFADVLRSLSSTKPAESPTSRLVEEELLIEVLRLQKEVHSLTQSLQTRHAPVELGRQN